MDWLVVVIGARVHHPGVEWNGVCTQVVVVVEREECDVYSLY